MKPLLFCCVAFCLLNGCHRTIEIGNYREPSKETALGPLVIRNRSVVVHFEEDKHNFDALIGANFRRGEHAEARIRNSLTQFYLGRGFTYLAGKYPFLETKLVTTIAEGTVYAVEIDGTTQRVYLLSLGRRDAVHIKLQPGVKRIPGATHSIKIAEQHYATVRPDAAGNYSIVDSGPIKGDNTVAAFIQELQDEVKAAGLLPTWPSNLP